MTMVVMISDDDTSDDDTVHCVTFVPASASVRFCSLRHQLAASLKFNAGIFNEYFCTYKDYDDNVIRLECFHNRYCCDFSLLFVLFLLFVVCFT